MTSRRLTRSVGIVALGRAATAGSILAVNGILARAWTELEVGLFSVVWVLSNTLIPIFLLGIPTSLLYFLPRREASGQPLLLRRSLYCLSGSGALVVALLYFAGPALAKWLEIDGMVQARDMGDLLLPFLPYVFALVAGGFIEGTLVVAGRPHWQAWLAIGLAIGLVIAALAAATLELRMEQVLLAFSFLGVARLAVGLWLVGKVMGFSGPNRDGTGLWPFARYSLSVGLSDSVGSLSRSVDRFVVLFFFQSELFAHYHFGAIEVPVSLLLSALVTVLVPEVSRLYKDGNLAEIGTLWRESISRLSMLIVPAFFFLFFFAEAVIALYLPAEYNRTYWVFRIFLLALPLRCAVYNPLLVGMGKPHWALWGGVGDLLLNLLLSVLAVTILLDTNPEWAFLGPAAATIASTYVQVTFLVMAIRAHLRWSVRRLLPWRALLRRFFISGLAAAVAMALVQSFDPGPQLCIGATLFILLVGTATWIHPQERSEVSQIVGALKGRG